jgi:hypothetical protein
MVGFSSKAIAWLRRHPFVCFLTMTHCFLVFGYLSVDLVRLIAANTDFVLANGWQAIEDGGLRQLLELWIGALAAMAFYFLFKLCEQVLLQWFNQHK